MSNSPSSWKDTFNAIGLLGTTFVLFLLLHLFDWDRGFQRGLVLIAMLLLLALLYVSSQLQNGSERNTRVFFVIFGILSTFHLYYFISISPIANPVDVGEISIRAIEAFWHDGVNPYASDVDKVDISHPDFFFDGNKYFPLTFLLYTPLVMISGKMGLYVTNLIFHIVAVVLIFQIGRELVATGRSGPTLLAPCFYLSAFLIVSELFKQGVNDILPVTFLTGAYLCLLRDKEMSAAWLCGASVACKWLPAPLFILIALAHVRLRSARSFRNRFW